MLNITKQYMNKGLSGRTYEKTGYVRIMTHQKIRSALYQKGIISDNFTK